ncbi:hypothetical protein PI124_g13139 [Phytophthora idaei]|nr:hypothetical protein PI125_g8035 [Phytophthora idaei]KAG3159770.1 hypothetical protein PI126_g7224 [Phytophthora idaei]KAG3242014.1 hypothetical protein PI124_g13139 [Phytophthora idaei]
MAGDDDNDAVYASILARVEQSELHNKLCKVVRKEYKSINRQVRHASSLLTVLRQLQAVSEHLRPSGDWLPKTLQTQLKNIEELQHRLDTAMNDLEMDAKGRRRKKKRKRPLDKKEIRASSLEEEEKEVAVNGSLQSDGDGEDGNELDILERDKVNVQEQEEESDVECLRVVAPVERRTRVENEDSAKFQAKTVNEEVVESGEAVELRVEKPIQEQHQEDDDSDVEIIEVAVDQRRVGAEEGAVGDNAKEESGDRNAEILSESDVLPCGLVRITGDAAMCIKEEPMTLPDNHGRERNTQVNAMYETQDMVESPIELEVLESSDSEQSAVEISDSEELAIELDVPDSDSEDDFSRCLQLVAKLQNSSTADQLVKFPVIVEQLRSYLLDHKNLTVTELDGYLFAHKRITDEEADEVGRAIETIICVGMTLPRRPKIKQALSGLRALVEQLECTLGELPVFLRPVVEKFSSYNIDSTNRDALL